MVAQMEQSKTGTEVPMTLEEALCASLAKMRALAAEAGTDDFFENWSREVLERRPLIVVSAVLQGQTLTWVIEPEGDAVFEAGVSHVYGPDGTPRDLGMADTNSATKLLDTIAHDVSWLVKEQTGIFLEERRVWRQS